MKAQMTAQTKTRPNRPKGEGIRIKALAGQGFAEIYLYGEFGWDIQASDFIRQFEDLKMVSKVTIRINSVGGDVREAIPIFNHLKEFGGEVEALVDGYALSAGSYVAMAADKVVMAENAVMMIHEPSIAFMGTPDKVRQLAEFAEKQAEQMMRAYSDKSGIPDDEMRALMKEELWMTAADAVARGFADELSEPMEITAKAMLDISAFKNVPSEIEAQMKVLFKTEKGEDPMTTKTAGKPNTATTPSAETTSVTPVVPVDTPTTEASAGSGADVKTAVVAERTRASGIMNLGVTHGVAQLEITNMLNEGLSLDQASTRILNTMAAKTEAAPGAPQARIHMVEDGVDKFRKGAELAVLHRASMGGEQNEFSGLTMRELARASLTLHGVRTGGMTGMVMVGQAFSMQMATHGSSDFGNILANVANKAMLMGAEETEETFKAWTSKGTLTDFRPASRVDIDHFPSLRKVPEGAEYKYVTIGDSGELVQLATFGDMFSISRHAIINDDMGAFTKVPRRMGRAAVRTVGNLVYTQLTANQNMANGTALFHASRKNLLTAAAITTDSLGLGKSAMAKQKSGDAVLNIKPRFLLVPSALEDVANTVVTGAYHSEKGDKQAPNIHRGKFEVVSDARLDDDSATGWYLAADPKAQDTIEVDYLDGNENPWLEQRDGWNVDGTEFKVRIDATAKALSARGLSKNAGL